MSLRLAIIVWGLVTLLAIFGRPITPIDETRYLAVAWEMYRSGESWLLTLNGDLYSHKPPLLFWLITLGWHLFGVQDLWPRFLTALFGLGVIGLTARCALRLSGGQRQVADLAALVLIGTLSWMLFTGAVMFDVPLTFFCLASITQLISMRDAGRPLEWCGVGVWIGLAVLTKGPVAFLQVLPIALLAPLWRNRLLGASVSHQGRSYVGVALAVIVAIAVSAVWLVPSFAMGGAALIDDYLWRQTVDRMANTTHHLRPWWFYLATLPVMLLPWAVIPSVWRGTRALLRETVPAVPVITLWVLPVLLALSSFDGKQLHYLFPLLPAFSILAAMAIHRAARNPLRTTALAVLFSLMTTISSYAVIQWRYAAAYDTAPLSRQIAILQERGLAVANVGRYHGQFHFAGRLREPLVVIENDEAWRRFLDSHPDGFVVTYAREKPAAVRTAVMSARFRSRWATVWRATDLRDRSFDDLQDR